jgi:hypothetical protein
VTYLTDKEKATIAAQEFDRRGRSEAALRKALADLVEAIGGDMDDILAAVDRAREVLAT